MSRWVSWSVFLFATILLFANVHSRAYSTNDISRMAAIESLVHRGSWQIDDSPFNHTLDKVFLNGHFYSDKPPVLAFLGTLIYWPLHYGLGWSLQAQGCEPLLEVAHCLAWREPTGADWAYVTLTLLLVVLPAALTATLAFQLGLRFGLSRPIALTGAAFLLLGTALLPYSTVFGNHIPAVAALFSALYLLITAEPPGLLRLIAVGFLASLAVTIDISAVFFAAGLALYLVLWRRAWLPPFVLGGLGPLLLLIGLDYWMLGSIRPPQTFAAGYAYEGSLLAAKPAGFTWRAAPGRYLFDIFLGDNGVLFFFPILFWYLHALYASRRLANQMLRRLLLTLTASGLLYIIFFGLATDNFGGFAFSVRWMLIPFVLAGLAAFVQPELYRRRGQQIAFVSLGALSILGASRGVISPWHPAYPLLRLETGSLAPIAYHPAAIAGYSSFAEIPPELLAGFGQDRVDRRWFDARGSLVVPAGSAWYFLGPATAVNPYFAARLGLPTANPATLQVDLAAPLTAYLATLTETAYGAAPLLPSEAELAPIPLPQTYTLGPNSLELVGYELIRSDGALAVNSAWRVTARQFPAGERRVFLHLLDEAGEIVAQSDYFGAVYADMQVGDYLLQQQDLALVGLPAGRYWLEMGLYEPRSGQRLPAAGQERLILAILELE